MTRVRTDQIRDCTCGKEVAWLPAASGGTFPVEIREGVERDAAGRKSATVDSEDLHACASFGALAKRLRDATARGSAFERRIRLRTERNEPVVFSWTRSSPHVNLSNGNPVETWTGYGTLDLDSGRFRPSDRNLEGLLELLGAFDRDPVHVAARYGRETGECCFCQRRLTDPRSVRVGYGPVCAVTHGLPWG